MESDNPRKRPGRPASGSPPDDLGSLAGRVRYARTLRRLTQDRLAELSGLKQGDISKIENGRILKTTGMPGLARALQCSVDWLDTGDGEKPSDSAMAGGVSQYEFRESPPPVYGGERTTSLLRRPGHHNGMADAVMTLWGAVQGHTDGRKDAVLGLLKEALTTTDSESARAVASHIEALLHHERTERQPGVANG